MGYSRKKNTGVEDILFSKLPWNFQVFKFNLPLEIPDKTNLHPQKLQKLCNIPQKFQGLKPRPLEIPHDFFWITPGNSTMFLINQRKYTCYFFSTPAGNYVLSTPPVWFFFWNSPILKQKQEQSFILFSGKPNQSLN